MRILIGNIPTIASTHTSLCLGRPVCLSGSRGLCLTTALGVNARTKVATAFSNCSHWLLAADRLNLYILCPTIKLPERSDWLYCPCWAMFMYDPCRHSSSRSIINNYLQACFSTALSSSVGFAGPIRLIPNTKPRSRCGINWSNNGCWLNKSIKD